MKDAACTWSLCSIRSGSTNCIDFPCPLESGPSSRFWGQPATGTRRVAGTTHCYHHRHHHQNYNHHHCRSHHCYNHHHHNQYYLHVPDEGSLLPKYGDCATFNDFQLYIYIYIAAFINICRFLNQCCLCCPCEVLEGPISKRVGII